MYQHANTYVGYAAIYVLPISTDYSRNNVSGRFALRNE